MSVINSFAAELFSSERRIVGAILLYVDIQRQNLNTGASQSVCLYFDIITVKKTLPVRFKVSVPSSLDF